MNQKRIFLVREGSGAEERKRPTNPLISSLGAYGYMQNRSVNQIKAKEQSYSPYIYRNIVFLWTCPCPRNHNFLQIEPQKVRYFLTNGICSKESKEKEDHHINLGGRRGLYDTWSFRHWDTPKRNILYWKWRAVYPLPPCRSQNLEKSGSLGPNGKSKPTTSVMITVTEKIYENHSRRSLAGSFGERL